MVSLTEQQKKGVGVFRKKGWVGLAPSCLALGSKLQDTPSPSLPLTCYIYASPHIVISYQTRSLLMARSPQPLLPVSLGPGCWDLCPDWTRKEWVFQGSAWMVMWSWSMAYSACSKCWHRTKPHDPKKGEALSSPSTFCPPFSAPQSCTFLPPSTPETFS